MQIESSIEELTSTARKLNVTVAAESVQERIQKELATYSKQAKVKGFRLGKVPVDLIKRLYGAEVKTKVVQDVIAASLRDAAQKHSISIVGTPKLTFDTDAALEAAGVNPLQYSADCSIYPTPAVTGYDTFAIEVPDRSVSEKQVNDVLDYMRKSRAELTPITDRTTLQKDDVAEVSIAIFDEGAEAGNPEPFSFCLGEGTLPKVIEDALAGIAVGEERDAFMAREGKEGKDGAAAPARLVYRAKLLALKSRNLPEVTDEFAKLADSSVDSVAALKAKIKEELEGEGLDKRIADQNGAIVQKLLASNGFDVPQELVDEEIIGLLERRGMIEPGKYDATTFPMEIVRKEMNDGALSRVRAAIIIDRIAEEAAIKLERTDIDAAISVTAKTHQMSPQEVGKIVLAKDRASGFLVETLRNKVLTTLRARAVVTEKAETASGEEKK